MATTPPTTTAPPRPALCRADPHRPGSSVLAVVFIGGFELQALAANVLLRPPRRWRAFLPVGDIKPRQIHAAFQRAPVGLFVFNSVLVTGTTVLLSLVVCSLAASASSTCAAGAGADPVDHNLANPHRAFETHRHPLLLAGVANAVDRPDGIETTWPTPTGSRSSPGSRTG